MAKNSYSEYKINIDEMPFLIIQTSHDNEIIYVNAMVNHYLGFLEDQLLGTDFFELLPKSSKVVIQSYVVPLLVKEHICEEVQLNLLDINNHRVPMTGFVSRPLDEDRNTTWCFFSAAQRDKLFEEFTAIRDTLEQKNRALESISSVDPVSGLPNKSQFIKDLSQKLRLTRRTEHILAVVLADIDRFREVNEQYGQDMADFVLMSIANRLQHNHHDISCLSRHAGDEFGMTIILEPGQQDLESKLQSINELISEPIKVGTEKISVTTSFGVAVPERDEDGEPEKLIKMAENALYKAKLLGGANIAYFDHSERQIQQIQIEMVEQIRAAIIKDEFQLFYQPKVELNSAELVGFEALIRWIHPEKGFISPAEFLPFVYGGDVDVELGNWVLKTAISQVRKWKDSGLSTRVSINISGIHLQSPEFMQTLENFLVEYDVDRSDIQIEVLETSAIEDVNHVASVVKSCSEMKVSVALDDFGTGFSTLSHLVDLSVDTLKVDRSFVSDMHKNVSNYAIVKGVISLADAFDMHVVAEGVESFEHVNLLKKLNCEVIQGYYISKPMPADDVPKWTFDWHNSESKAKL